MKAARLGDNAARWKHQKKPFLVLFVALAIFVMKKKAGKNLCDLCALRGEQQI
ncbi:MAG: hypothetical protein ACLFVU_00865 [Phycisphaerae bacterium]